MPFIDLFRSELEERFKKHWILLENFQCIFKLIVDAEYKKQWTASEIEFYASDIERNSDDVFIDLNFGEKK